MWNTFPGFTPVPLKHPDTITRTFEHQPAGERALGRVLVVNDSNSKQYAVALALRADGFDVVEVTSAKEALQAALERSPDAVVVDLSVPEHESFDICLSLKAASSTFLPVLYLSSRTSRAARARALDAGFDVYLTNPFDSSELCAAIGALIRLKRQEAARIATAALGLLLDDALDALADHVALLGPDSTIIAVNRAWTDFADDNGATEKVGVGSNYRDVCDRATGDGAADAHAASNGIGRVLSGAIATFELDYACHAPTQERWHRMLVRRVSGGGPVAAIVTHMDRTREHVAAQAEALALALADADRRRLEATLAAIPIGVWIADATGRLTHSNPAAALIWGGAAPLAQTIEGYSVYRGWWSETGVEVAAEEWTLAKTLRTGQSLTDFFEIERFDGTRGHILNSAAPILDEDGTLLGGVVVAMDVTERTERTLERFQLLASLETERSRLVAIFEKAPSFLAVLRGPEYVFERANPAYLQLVGHRNPVGLPLATALPEVIGQGYVELLDAVRITGEPFIGRQLPVQLSRTPGAPLETRYVDLVYQRLTDADGQHSIIAHGNDVTESVLANQELTRAKQLLFDQFAKLPVPTYLWEARGDDFVLLISNEAAVRAAPSHGAQAIGRVSRELFPGMDGVREEMFTALRENKVVRCTAQFEGGPKLGVRRVELTIGPQPPNRLLVHAVDTTKRIELEAQLRQAQKMDAVGRLAGGVAHDFNNLLTVIGAHAAFLMESLDSNDALHEDAEAIQKAGIRASGLTRQLLAFSRKQILKPSVLDLNSIIAEMENMLRRLLGEDIDIVTALALVLRSVIADAGQIEQVIMNLAVNARDAMPDGGTLTIGTRNVVVDESSGREHHMVGHGEYVVIDVSDTGIGMDAELKARLFEPFFTTKEPGKGTGLGLATVYGVVKQSAGYVLVDSTPGEGTSFRVYLPAVEANTVQNDLRVAEDGAVRGIETILLVEDEPAVREIAKRILTQRGYIVLSASSGAEALSISAEFDSIIHLVISDSVMPGMTGAEAVRRLQEQRPALKALFMSGYTDDEILRRGIVASTAAFIQKPFMRNDFARAVREALDG